MSNRTEQLLFVSKAALFCKDLFHASDTQRSGLTFLDVSAEDSSSLGPWLLRGPRLAFQGSDLLFDIVCLG